MAGAIAGVALATATGVAIATPRLLPLAGALVLGVCLLVVPPRALVFGLAIPIPYLYRFFPAANFAFAVVLLPFAVASVRRGVPRALLPVLIVGSAMVGRLLVGLPGGGDASVGSVLRLLVPLEVALVAANAFRSSGVLAPLATAMLALPVLLATFELLSGTSFATGAGLAAASEGRISGGMSSASELGVFSALVFAATWPVAVERRGWALAPVPLSAYCVVLSGTRVALAALILSAVVPALLTRGRAAPPLRRAFAALVIVGVLVSPLAGTAVARVAEGIAQGRTQFVSRATDTPLGIRAVVWQQLVESYAASSSSRRAFGQGPGASERLAETSFSGGLHLPHNEYLRFLVDYGWVGLLLFVASVIAYPLILGMRRLGTPRLATPISLAMALMALSLTDNPLLYPQAMLIPLVALGLYVRQAS